MNELDALAPELARLDAVIELEVRRLRARYELSLDEFRGLYITDERVDALLRERDRPADSCSIPDVSAIRADDAASRWHQIAAALHLDDDERDLLLVCLAPELDDKYETLYAYLHDDVTRRWPTADLAARVLGRSEAHRVALRGRLQPGGTLLESGALEVPATQRDHPRGRRPLRVAPPLVDWLRGLSYVDERLHGIARFGASKALVPDGALPSRSRQMLQGLAQQLHAGGRLPPVVLSALTPLAAALAAEDLFARAHRTALVVDLAALKMSSPRDVVAALELAQCVLSVGLVVSPLDDAIDQDGRVLEGCATALRRLARRSPALILASGPAARASEILGDLLTLTIALPDPTPLERAAAWRGALAGAPHGEHIHPPDALVSALADRFVLGTDQIFRAAAAATEAAALEGAGRPTPAQVFAAARRVSTGSAGATTRTINTEFGWEDLVLPAEVKARLSDVVQAIERRSLVLDEWGFGRRVGGARGIRVMFAGASGTGKTMAAAIVARTLQLDLHRIEIGAVVSKYLGETEKNLDRAFEAARRANAVLFIDEADALLGKRSQVKDAHDRYANVEIAYLLQKMEDHDGIVIVATNLAQNIDDAFSRRMQFVIEFPMPDVVGRERLWRGLIPESAPLASDVDFTFLARQFEMTGGDIRNVVLDAAYRAAQNGREISMGHLLRAVARQFAKRGRVPTMADFREHYGLLADESRDGVRRPADAALGPS